MAKAHGIGCQICTTSWGIAAEGFSRKSSRVAETVSGIHRSNGKDFGESDWAGQNIGEKRDHWGVAPEADKGRTSCREWSIRFPGSPFIVGFPLAFLETGSFDMQRGS